MYWTYAWTQIGTCVKSIEMSSQNSDNSISIYPIPIENILYVNGLNDLVMKTEGLAWLWGYLNQYDKKRCIKYDQGEESIGGSCKKKEDHID